MPSTPDTHVRDLYDSLAEKGYSDGVETSSSNPSSPTMGYVPHEGQLKGSNISVHNIGRAIAGRTARTVRRGNLPFLVIFLM